MPESTVTKRRKAYTAEATRGTWEALKKVLKEHYSHSDVMKRGYTYNDVFSTHRRIKLVDWRAAEELWGSLTLLALEHRDGSRIEVGTITYRSKQFANYSTSDPVIRIYPPDK